MNLNMTGKRSLVSGGMSPLGQAITHHLAREGVDTLITYNDISRAEEVFDFCTAVSRSYDVYCGCIRIDLTDSGSVSDGLAELTAQFPSLDMFISNAGIFTVSSQEDLAEEQWDQVMDVNIKGMWRMVRGVQGLLAETHGTIVAVSSINASRPGFGNTAHYDASKGALSAYIRSLSAELAPLSIRVNAVAPGLLDSPSLRQDGGGLVERYKSRSFTSSLVDIDCVASTIVYLASPLASSITGEIVTIDGGYSIS